MKLKSSLTAILVIVFSGLGLTQGVSSKVYKHIQNKEYSEALTIINTTEDIKDNEKALHARAIIYYNLGENAYAITDIARTKILGNDHNELNYYLAKIYHKQGRYKDAIEWYKKYLAGKEQKIATEEEILKNVRYCLNGQKQKTKYELFLDHLPSPVNTDKDEYAILRSPIFPSTIYFSRKDSEGSDIYSYSIGPDGWENQKDILSKIDKKNNAVIKDISEDGQVVFFHAELKKKLILMLQKSNTRDKVYMANMPYFPDLGDKDLCLVDEKTILFSSLRPNGYGGYDLYISKYAGTQWSLPQNLGPKINSSYNDIAPHITQDGKYIFFSSDNTNSIGGYDVFYSEKKNNSWSSAKTLGPPLNSPSDDIDFSLEQDGVTASLSSNRDGTLGGYDIYFAYFKDRWVTELKSINKLAYLDYSIAEKTEDIASTTIEKPSNKEPQEKIETKSEPVIAEKIETETVVVNTPSNQSKKTEPKYGYIDPVSNNKVGDSAKKKEPVVEQKPQKPEKKEVVTAPVKTNSRKARKQKKEEIDETNVLRIAPLFYEDNKEILSLENEEKLSNLIKAMKLFPESKVELTNFIMPGPLKEFELFFGISWSQDVVDYLLSRGVSENRIILNTVGASYPYTLRESGGKEKEEYLKKNQRIEMQLLNLPAGKQATYIGMDVPSSYQDRRYGLYRVVKDDVHFRVEIAKQNRIFKHSALRYYDDIMVTKNIKTGDMTYTVGFYENLNKALDVRAELNAKNLTNCSIVVYLGGEQMSKSELSKLSDTNSDIKKYLDQAL